MLKVVMVATVSIMTIAGGISAVGAQKEQDASLNVFCVCLAVFLAAAVAQVIIIAK